MPTDPSTTASDHQSTAELLAEMTGRDPEEFEADGYEHPSLDELELVTDGGEPQETEIERSPSREHGHCRRGYAVEFNLDGVCSCRTLTVETQQEAEMFASILEDRDDTGRVRVVRDE